MLQKPFKGFNHDSWNLELVRFYTLTLNVVLVTLQGYYEQILNVMLQEIPQGLIAKSLIVKNEKHVIMQTEYS